MVTKEWSKAKVLKLTFVFALAVEIIQDWVRCAYLIFVRNAGNAVSVKFLAECKKFQKNEKITALGSVYIAAVMYYFTLSV